MKPQGCGAALGCGPSSGQTAVLCVGASGVSTAAGNQFSVESESAPQEPEGSRSDRQTDRSPRAWTLIGLSSCRRGLQILTGPKGTVLTGRNGAALMGW